MEIAPKEISEAIDAYKKAFEYHHALPKYEQWKQRDKLKSAIDHLKNTIEKHKKGK